MIFEIILRAPPLQVNTPKIACQFSTLILQEDHRSRVPFPITKERIKDKCIHIFLYINVKEVKTKFSDLNKYLFNLNKNCIFVGKDFTEQVFLKHPSCTTSEKYLKEMVRN